MTALATRPPLSRRIWRAVRIAWLRLLIWDLRRYIAECEKAGIFNTASLAEFRGQLGALRCELAITEASA